MLKPISWSINYTNVQSPSYFGSGWTAVASPPTSGEDELNITFEQLKSEHKDRLIKVKGEVSDQVLRNHSSVLNSYLTYCGKNLENQVGRELSTDFPSQTKAYLDIVAVNNPKTAADKMSILRAWKRTFDQVKRKSKLQDIIGASAFHKELRLAIMMSGSSINEITQAINAGMCTIYSWLDGAYPYKKGLPALRRLEKHLGLPPGHLESTLPHLGLPGATKNNSIDKFSERHRENCRDLYIVKVKNLTDNFKDEWKLLVQYKTAGHTTELLRSRRGVWRALSNEKLQKKIWQNELCQVSSDQACPTAHRSLFTVLGFLGFLVKPAGGPLKTAGLGLPDSTVQSIGLLAIPEYLNAYFEFVKARAGNRANSSHLVAAGLIANLVAPITGYLRQQPAFFEKIKIHAKGRSWEQLCDATMQLCASWQKISKGKKSRDPKTPLQNLLSLKEPLLPFKRAIQALDEDAARQPSGVIAKAVYKRDALLLAVLMSNPLRERTLSITKYIPPGEPRFDESNLYQTEAGEWRLRFFKGDMKNDEYKDEDYDAPLPKGLNRRLEEYLEQYRPVLTRKNPQCPSLFPSRKGEMHAVLGDRISKAAQKYIPEVARLRAHALRHLVATDFLAKNPGKYTFLAELLHDNLETVLRNYAHGKKETAFKAHEEHLKDFFDGI